MRRLSLTAFLLGDLVMKTVNKIGLGTVLASIVPAVNAAALDTTSASAAMASISDTVPVIGGLFLGVLGLMAAWKLARGLFA
jgi:uncharacterized protein YacL